MKIIGLILISFSAFSQITEIVVPKRETKETYDSTQDYLGQKFKLYVGQELYLKGMPESSRQYGFPNFSIEPNGSPLNKKNIYKCCEGDGYNSKYEELHGKYFTVLDVLNNSSQHINEVYLKLQEKQTNDVIF